MSATEDRKGTCEREQRAQNAGKPTKRLDIQAKILPNES